MSNSGADRSVNSFEVRTAAGTVHVERAGEGRTLLVISGSGSSLATSALLLEPLRRAFDVIAFDHRGMGLSSCPPPPWTMADHAGDCLAVLDACGLESVAVVGISFGGMVALELAVSAPERVERLCLCCTSAGGEAGSSYPLHLLALLPPDERVQVSRRLLDSRFSDVWLEDHPIDRAMAERLEAAAIGRTGENGDASDGYDRQMAARAGHDTAARLGHLTMPTLVMAGRFDGVAPLANSEAIVARVTGAELKSYDGGHLFLAQAPAAFRDAASFLRA
jgi:3-oxoadipate enol-lactonase